MITSIVWPCILTADVRMMPWVCLTCLQGLVPTKPSTINCYQSNLTTHNLCNKFPKIQPIFLPELLCWTHLGEEPKTSQCTNDAVSLRWSRSSPSWLWIRELNKYQTAVSKWGHSAKDSFWTLTNNLLQYPFLLLPSISVRTKEKVSLKMDNNNWKQGL